MNKLRLKSLASSIARAKLNEAFAPDFANCTGTVQLDANGGAWVHCMVFVPPVDIEERVIADRARKAGGS